MTTYAIIGAGALVLVFLVWLAFRYARRAGHAEAERDDAKRTAEQADEALEIDEDVKSLSSDELDRELRGR